MKLQNNNIEPQKDNSHHRAIKDEEYINEVKPTKPIMPSMGQAIADGISNLSLNATKILNQFNQKKEEIETINLKNDFLIEYNNRTKRYKQEYQLNPQDKNITINYENDVKKLTDDYQKKMPNNFYKNNFFIEATQIQKKNDLDFFRKQTDLNFQLNKFNDTLNNNIENIQNQGLTNNIEAIAEAIATIPLFTEQAKTIYGEYQGEEVIKQYKQKMLKGYLSGQLMSDIPIKVKQTLNQINNMPQLKNILTDIEIKQFKKQAEQQQKAIDSWNKHREVAEYMIKNNLILSKINNGEINSYNDIIDNLIANNANEYDSKLILKFAGYDTILPPELIENIKKNKINEKTNNSTIEQIEEISKQKWTEADKIKMKSIIQQRILGLSERDMSDYKDKDFTQEENYTKDLQTFILQTATASLITKAEAEDYLKQLEPRLNDIYKSRNILNFKDDGGWLHTSIGYSDFKKEIDRILINNGYSNGIKTKEKELKNNDKYKYYKIRNDLDSNYYQALQQIFRREKINNPKFNNVNNFQEFYSRIDYNNRNKLYLEAQKIALENFAIGNNIIIPEMINGKDYKKAPTQEQVEHLMNRIKEYGTITTEEELINMIDIE